MEEPIKVTPIGNGRHLVIYPGDDPEERSPVFLREADGTEMRLFKAQDKTGSDGKTYWTLITADHVDMSEPPGT